MDKQKVRERILEIGIVPVVRASSAGEACIAAEAVCQGGIPIVEITMTVPGAVERIRELVKNCGSSALEPCSMQTPRGAASMREQNSWSAPG